MLLWVWIAVVVVALLVLGFAAVPLLGRLGGLRRALAKLQRRQAEAMRLREKAAVLERGMAQVQAKIAAIAPASGRK